MFHSFVILSVSLSNIFPRMSLLVHSVNTPSTTFGPAAVRCWDTLCLQRAAARLWRLAEWMCISLSTLVDFLTLARALQQENLGGFYRNKRAAPLPLCSPLLCQTWKGRRGLFGKGRGLLWSRGRHRGGGVQAQRWFCVHWSRLHWTWKSFCRDFRSDISLMPYSWSSFFWLHRLPFNHHTNDVFSEAHLIVSAYVFFLLVCLHVCCVAVFVCVSVCVKEGVHLHIWFSSVQHLSEFMHE